MSLTPIFDDVVADLGYKPIETLGFIFKNGRASYAYDLLLLNPRFLLPFGRGVFTFSGVSDA